MVLPTPPGRGLRTAVRMMGAGRGASVVDAVALVAGTTVGGGFLALPHVAAPAGFVPTAATLVGSWAVLAAEALVVAECVASVARGTKKKNNSNNTTNTDSNSNETQQVSVASVARSVGGRSAEVGAVGLFAILGTATAASQLAKAAHLVAGPRLGAYQAWTGAVAGAAALLAFGPNLGAALALNTALGITFAVSAIWSGRAALATTKEVAAVVLLVPNADDWAAARRAVPTVLQLLVFAETVPTVSAALNHDPKRTRVALLVGSLLPLLLEAAWAWLGLRLVPPTKATLGGGGLRVLQADPFQVMLALPRCRTPLLVLAFSAIATTLLGTLITLRALADDFLLQSRPHGQKRRRDLFWAPLAAIAPAAFIAAASPDAFFQAVEFAGAYPVALLWGVAPPLAALKLRRLSKKDPAGEHPRFAGPNALLYALLLVSTAFVASTIRADGAKALSRFFLKEE